MTHSHQQDLCRDVFGREANRKIHLLLKTMNPSNFSRDKSKYFSMVKHLLQCSESAFSKSFDGLSPDPSTVEGFVSLGEAKQAVQNGLHRIELLEQNKLR